MECDIVFCPMIDGNIEDIDCIENRDIVDGIIVDTSMPNKYKTKKDWKEICKNCKFHNY